MKAKPSGSAQDARFVEDEDGFMAEGATPPKFRKTKPTPNFGGGSPVIGLADPKPPRHDNGVPDHLVGGSFHRDGENRIHEKTYSASPGRRKRTFHIVQCFQQRKRDLFYQRSHF